jgi:hypothetical protein
MASNEHPVWRSHYAVVMDSGSEVFGLEVYDTLADLQVMYRFHPAPQQMAQMATCYNR